MYKRQSLAIDSNDNLHVTYQDEVYDNLEYVTYGGSSWSSPVTLDSSGDLGYYSSLAIDSNDNLHVTYLDSTNDNLEYMTHDGSSWSTPVSLDSTDDVGSDSSLAIDSNDNLHVTYYDYTNENLEYMIYSNSAGGNNTGNSTGNSTNLTVVNNTLMFGNSYTSFNSLHTLLEDLGVQNADALTGGGKKLSAHWNEVNTSGHVSNTTLRDANIDWDYVVLQDQSQVPGFYRTNADWLASMNGAVGLAGAVEDEGGESILMMTWGRRNGDAMNPTLYSNFSVMQDRLESGYIDYHDNMTAAGNTVWIAPVGLAFAHIHDSVMASGINATVSGNTFYDLYNADGSHPSLAGSYLAACVLYATMTGDSPVGSSDTVSLNATLKLELQQAAAATVFNETSHLSYPWQATGTATSSMMMSSSRGLGGGIPAGWNVQWVDDEFANMAAGSSETASLHISVPSNAAPDYYGFRLFSASTGGNVSTSTMLVVHVDEEHNLSIAFLDQYSDFVPGLSTNSSVQVTNTGNAIVDYDWSLSLLNGPCQASLATASTPSLAPNTVVDINFQITVDEQASKSDDCDLKLEATGTSSSEQHEIEPFLFTVDMDELIDFELTKPMGQLEVTPGNPITYEMRITNNGSETVNFYLDALTPPELQTSFVSSSSVQVSPGAIGVWTLSTDGVSGQAGNFMQTFLVSYAGETSYSSFDIEVLGVSHATLSGPLDGRIQTQPSDSVVTMFNLSNTGTSNLTLYGSLIGLPAGTDATLSHAQVELSIGQTIEVSLTIDTQSTASAGTYQLSFGYFDSNMAAETSISLLIQDRFSVKLNPMFGYQQNTPLPVGPFNATNGVIFDMLNTGSTQDTLYLSLLDYDGALEWFTFEFMVTSAVLDSSGTMLNYVTFREIATGAPSSGVTVGIILQSTSDSNVSDHMNITLIPSTSSAELLVLSDDDSAEPNGTIYGTVVVTNTGNAGDDLQITTVGIDCGVTSSHQLMPGQSSDAIPWSCTIPSDSEAGLKELVFRVTSSSRPTYSITSSEIYTVEPVWGSSGVLDISLDKPSLTVPSSGGSTVMVTVTNLANAQVSGTLSVEGIGDGLMAIEWVRLSDNTTTNEILLTPGSSTQYALSLTSLVSTNEQATLRIRATYLIDDTTLSDVSDDFTVEIDGPELPPNGVRLPFGMDLSQSDSINALFGGWGLSFLLLAVLYLLRGKKNTSIDEEESEADEVEEEKEEVSLGFNECRMEGGKVSCPSCEARLGVPRGSEPPFRFTCPKCSTMIRVVE